MEKIEVFSNINLQSFKSHVNFSYIHNSIGNFNVSISDNSKNLIFIDCESIRIFSDVIVFSKQIETEVQKLITRNPGALIYISKWDSHNSSSDSFSPFRNTRTASFINKQVEDLILNLLNKFPLNISFIKIDSILVENPLSRVESRTGYYAGRMKFTALGSSEIQKRLENFITLSYQEAKKVIALDFDNTIWGGVIGEDEDFDIKIGFEGEGMVFYEFQRMIKDLYLDGIILIGLTKNNESDVVEFFKRHDDMPLKYEDFTHIASNWEPKSKNLKEIINALNLDFSSVVFLDDSEFERTQMISELNDVVVPKLDSNPIKRIEQMNNVIIPNFFYQFTQNSFSEERLQNYKTRLQLKNHDDCNEPIDDSAGVLKVDTFRNDKAHFSRVVEMSKKTNQFNNAKTPLTINEINQFMNLGYDFYCFNFEDSYGREGITAYVMVKQNNKVLEIEYFVLSCRVIGRGLDEYIINLLAKEFIDCKKIKIKLIESSRNRPIFDFVFKNGFAKSEDENNDVYYEKVING
jgi:FkbH-like protein